MKKNIWKLSLFMFVTVLFVTVLFCPEAEADGGVFEKLSVRTREFAVGLRNLAYAISGFGIIMFTYLAICGKINFKHLGYIFISLFMLSGVGAFIDYFSGGNTNLKVSFGTKYVNAAGDTNELHYNTSLGQ